MLRQHRERIVTKGVGKRALPEINLAKSLGQTLFQSVRNRLYPLFHMEPLVRFELTTYSLRVNCSTPELQRLGISQMGWVGELFSIEYRCGKRKNHWQARQGG